MGIGDDGTCDDRQGRGGLIALRGHVHMTSAKVSGFLTPSPPCLYFGPIHSTKFTQPPLLHLLLGYPPPPSHCRHHMYMPPSGNPF